MYGNRNQNGSCFMHNQLLLRRIALPLGKFKRVGGYSFPLGDAVVIREVAELQNFFSPRTNFHDR